MKKEKEPEKFEPIIHEANGSSITPGLTDYIRQRIANELEIKPTQLRMAKSQWKKIVRSYEEVVPGLTEQLLEWSGFPVELDRTVPEHEIWYEAKDGKIVGKIVGLER